MWQRLSAREKRLVWGLGVILILAGSYFLILNRLLPHYLSAVGEVSELQQQVDSQSTIAASGNKIQQLKNELEQRLQQLRTQTGFNPADGAPYLTILESLPRDLELDGLYPGEIADSGILKRMPLKIIARGGQQEVEEFLLQVEQLQNATEIDSLSLFQEGDMLKLELELSLYGTDEKDLSKASTTLKEMGKLNAFEEVVKEAPASSQTGPSTQKVPRFPAADAADVPQDKQTELQPEKGYVYDGAYSFPVKVE